MRLSICEFTTLGASFEEDLAAYRAAGVEGIGVCEMKLGDGVLDLAAVFRTLETGGYAGWYDVEIFSDNGVFGDAFPDALWDVDAVELARRARESVERILARA